MKEIKENLSKNKEVQIFFETKKSKKKYGHIIANQPNERWQIDIYYLMKYYKKNHGYKYILACIDIFTRKLYCVPMKTKEITEVYKSIKSIFDEAETTPYVLTSDSDSTFLSHECQKLFKKNDIYHNVVPVGDHKSLSVIDRVARTLKTILHKKFVKNNSTNWVDSLQIVVNNYNNSPHSSIDDIKPNDATKPENIAKIIEINNLKRQDKTTFKNEFKEGDKVRIQINGFNKKTEGSYSDDIYIVKSVHGKNVTLNNNKVKKYDML